MSFVMAASTKHHTIGNLKALSWGLFPRLNVVDNGHVFSGHVLIAVLAYLTISGEALVSPLNVTPIVKLSSLISYVRRTLGSFGRTLLFGSSFIATLPAAKPSFFGIILVTPKSLSTFLTIFIETCLFHGRIVTWRPQ